VFRQHERRDAMYKTATFLVGHFWGRPAEMADSLGVLLLTWNQAFYRYGPFDFGKLEACIAENMPALEAYRARSILDYAANDDAQIKALFDAFLTVLAIADGTGKGKRSPVAVAKTLHLLGPAFFPLWDREIALAYGCDYSREPREQYLAFVKMALNMARALHAVTAPEGKTLLKLIDEYNYAKYTKRWI
jgi:hypothetical protein